MNRKFKYVNPTGLRKRTWMIGIAVAITAAHTIIQYVITGEFVLLELGIIFLALLPIMIFDRVENRSIFATISSWIIAFLIATFYFWMEIIIGVIAILVNIVVLLISCIFIYKR